MCKHGSLFKEEVYMQRERDRERETEREREREKGDMCMHSEIELSCM